MKQKYLEVLNYDVDEWFLSRLGSLDVSRSRDILKQITNAEPDLPIKNGWSQIIAGVTVVNEPYFFEIEYLKQESNLLYPTHIRLIQRTKTKYLS